MASTGTILDAWYAGTIPEMTPANVEIRRPQIALFTDRKISYSNQVVAKYDAIITRRSPMIPPIIHKMIDSIKNSKSIFFD